VARRARDRYQAARALALESGLEASLIAVIDLRLEQLAPADEVG
jgi:hypothetical protein